MLSVCIVTGRRIPLLDACLASLAAQRDAPPFEVLICSDGDPAVDAAVRRRFPDARVCAVDRALPGTARNLLVSEARGELLVFLDDDVTVEPGMLARLARMAAEHPDVGVFGGPNETPPNSSSFQIVQGAVLASTVGSGPVRRRYRAHAAGPADERWLILCNLAVRRELMVPFSTELVCAEENGVLHELAERGVAMRYDPSLVVYHQRRATLRGFAQQMHKYGRGRGQLAVREPRSLRPLHLVPTGLIAYTAASPLLAGAVGPVALAPLGLYLLAVLAAAAWLAWSLRTPAALPPAVACFVVLHAAYGAGVVTGLLDRREERPAPEVLSWIGDEPGPPATRSP